MNNYLFVLGPSRIPFGSETKEKLLWNHLSLNLIRNRNAFVGSCLWKFPQNARLKKTTAISAETGISRQHGEIRAPIEGPVKPLAVPQHNGIEGLKGAPQLGPHYAERREPLGQPT